MLGFADHFVPWHEHYFVTCHQYLCLRLSLDLNISCSLLDFQQILGANMKKYCGKYEEKYCGTYKEIKLDFLSRHLLPPIRGESLIIACQQSLLVRFDLRWRYFSDLISRDIFQFGKWKMCEVEKNTNFTLKWKSDNCVNNRQSLDFFLADLIQNWILAIFQTVHHTHNSEKIGNPFKNHRKCIPPFLPLSL